MIVGRDGRVASGCGDNIPLDVDVIDCADEVDDCWFKFGCGWLI